MEVISMMVQNVRSMGQRRVMDAPNGVATAATIAVLRPAIGYHQAGLGIRPEVTLRW